MSKASVAQARREAYECAAAGDHVAAVARGLLAVKDGGFQKTDCNNLAFLAFHLCDAGARVAIYDELRGLGIEDAAGAPAVFLRLSFALDLGDGTAPRLVRELYLDRILRPQVRVWPSRPIVFWHVPRCSGTSMNEAIGGHFYSAEISDLLPGYGFLPLVRYLASEIIAEIPFLPSRHLSFDDLAIKARTFSFTILRDPVTRCLSMYRQEQAAFRKALPDLARWYHHRVLPRYGAFWDYREDSSFEAWLANIPEWLLKRQITTFSRDGDADEAARRLLGLDYLLARDFEFGSEAELFAALDIPWTDGAVPAGRNTSVKDVEIPAGAEDRLNDRIASEYVMLERIRSPHRAHGQRLRGGA